MCSSKKSMSKLQQDIHSVNINSRSSVLITESLNSINFQSYNKICFILDLKCEMPGLFIQIKKLKLFRYQYKWLLINDSNNYSEDFIQYMPLRLDSDIVFASSSDTNKFDLFSLTNPGRGSLNMINKIGYYDGQLNYYKNRTFYKNRFNMTGVALKTAVVLTFNFTGDLHDYLLDRRYKYKDVISKFHYKMFLVLSAVHDFSFETLVANVWYGNATNGLDGGLAELIYKQKIDISATAAAIKVPSIDFIDYFPPYYTFHACFIFRNPGVYNRWSNEVLKPFTTVTWCSIFICSLVLCVSVKYFSAEESRLHGFGRSYSWTTCILTITGVITQQGISIKPKHIGTRIILFWLFFFSLVLYNYYTSALVSAILQTNAPKLKTLTQMMDSDLKLASEDQPYTRTYLKNIYDPEVIRLNHSKLEYMPLEEGISKIQSGKYAYHADVSSAYPILSRKFDAQDICDLGEIDMYPLTRLSFLTQKKSQYKKLFSITLVKFMETGVFQRELFLNVAQKPECLATKKILSVTANQIFLAYIIWFSGITLALIIFSWEVCYSKYKFLLSKTLNNYFYQRKG